MFMPQKPSPYLGIIVRSVVNANKHIGSAEYETIVTAVCRYWSLKRTSKRGAPLLKRLHLDDVSNQSLPADSEPPKVHRYKALRELRNDLDRLRTLAELVRKREKFKLQRFAEQRTFVHSIAYPLTGILETLLALLQRYDRRKIFAYPVDTTVVTDYTSIVKNPMDLSAMEGKVQRNEYEDLDSFRADLDLMCANSMAYNHPDTPYYKAGEKLKRLGNVMIDAAVTTLAGMRICPKSGLLLMEEPPALFDAELLPLDEPEEEEEEEVFETAQSSRSSNIDTESEASTSAEEDEVPLPPVRAQNAAMDDKKIVQGKRSRPLRRSRLGISSKAPWTGMGSDRLNGKRRMVMKNLLTRRSLGLTSKWRNCANVTILSQWTHWHGQKPKVSLGSPRSSETSRTRQPPRFFLKINQTAIID